VTENNRHIRPSGSAGFQPALLMVARTATLLIILLFLSPAFAQQNGISKNGSYTISGDNVFGETDDAGVRHVKADGNVHLTYVTGNSTWQLSSDSIEYIEQTKDKAVVVQTADASGNVEISGPGITVTTPGNVSADILAGKLVCDGNSIHAIFENGKINTNHLEITITTTPEGRQKFIVDTSVHTTGSYILTKEYLPGVAASSNSQSSLFGALDSARFRLRRNCSRHNPHHAALYRWRPGLARLPGPVGDHVVVEQAHASILRDNVQSDSIVRIRWRADRYRGGSGRDQSWEFQVQLSARRRHVHGAKLRSDGTIVPGRFG
jgi:hypothetical protein